ncbi:MAG: TIGR03088 family PEP-CTERM/XrtA system glycosyltransferase [Thauera sp.]|nr:MAG: TIGR03088 family PEP-CTERM/XrtA system glycosyltransferase [Thauera sp.]
MKKVVHVIHHFGTGGIENGMVNLFNNFPQGEFDHHVVCLQGHSHFVERIRPGRVTFHDVKKRPGKDPAHYFRLWRMLRALRPDVLHTRNLSALEAVIVGWLAGVPARVHGEHGRDVFDLDGSNTRYNRLRRLVKPFVHRYLTVSRDLQSWLSATVGVEPARIHQIYNGVDKQRFHPRTDARRALLPADFGGDRFVLGSVGRMVGVKDYPTLVRAFIDAVRQPGCEDLRLVIVGDGGSRAECQRLLDEAGVADRAWLAGERKDIPDLMRCFDLFVLPSLGEGISNTILEAMACGLPVVATAVGGTPELVEDGVNGRLFTPGDVAALSSHVQQYASDAALRNRHGSASRQKIEASFSIEAMVAAYRDTYLDMTGRR